MRCKEKKIFNFGIDKLCLFVYVKVCKITKRIKNGNNTNTDPDTNTSNRDG